jgi:hypothetical protein
LSGGALDIVKGGQWLGALSLGRRHRNHDLDCCDGVVGDLPVRDGESAQPGFLVVPFALSLSKGHLRARCFDKLNERVLSING